MATRSASTRATARIAALLCGALLCAACHSGQEAQQSLTGTVVSIADGDSMEMRVAGQSTHKVRLHAIDAPERGQAYSRRSREHLARLIHGREVTVLSSRQDDYGRIIGKVMTADPACREVRCPHVLDVGLEQVRAGLAWHYRHYASEQPPAERRQYTQAEEKARSHRLGLWRDDHPLPPYEFRRHRHSGSNPALR